MPSASMRTASTRYRRRTATPSSRAVLDLGRREPGADQLGAGCARHHPGPEPAGDDPHRCRRQCTWLRAVRSAQRDRAPDSGNQMVLGRAPFGRRGAIVPGLIQCLLTMAWVGVNTWVVLDLVLAVLGKLGIHGGAGLEYVVAAAIMLVQLGLALYGFYAIRTFEKYTVPLTVLVMAIMTLLALSRADLHWTAAAASTPADKLTAMTQLMTAIGVGW